MKTTKKACAAPAWQEPFLALNREQGLLAREYTRQQESLRITAQLATSLLERVAVLESQVRSLQAAAPKGIPDLHRESKR